MRLDEIENTLLDMRPDGGPSFGARRIAGQIASRLAEGRHVLDWHNHIQIERLLRGWRDDGDRPSTGQEGRHLVDWPNGCREADALRRLGKEGVEALGRGALAAAIGPAIGPCCYEVGEEVAAPYRERFGDDVMQGRNLDLWTSAERALRAARVTRIHRFDRCTSCEAETFFSHRRDDGETGRQGVIAYVAG